MGGLLIVCLAFFCLTCTQVGAQSPSFSFDCNGHNSLCYKTLDKVVMAGAHNSYSTFCPAVTNIGMGIDVSAETLKECEDAEDDCVSATGARCGQRTWYNTLWTLDEQLNHGMRMFMFDTWNYPKGSDNVVLCHNCELSVAGVSLQAPAMTHKWALNKLKTFLGNNPNEVVVLIYEDYTSGQFIEEVSEVLGSYLANLCMDGFEDQCTYLSDYKMWIPNEVRVFPKLGDMINSGGRVVIVTDTKYLHDPSKRKIADVPAWVQYTRWTEVGMVTETEYEFASHQAIVQSGTNLLKSNAVKLLEGGALLLMNHFLTAVAGAADATLGGGPELAAMANFETVLQRANKIKEVHGRMVNIIAVDWPEFGHVMQTVDTLNEVNPRPFECKAVGGLEYCCASGHPNPNDGGSPCSGHGTCNRTSGTCSCEGGWGNGDGGCMCRQEDGRCVTNFCFSRDDDCSIGYHCNTFGLLGGLIEHSVETCTKDQVDGACFLNSQCRTKQCRANFVCQPMEVISGFCVGQPIMPEDPVSCREVCRARGAAASETTNSTDNHHDTKSTFTRDGYTDNCCACGPESAALCVHGKCSAGNSECCQMYVDTTLDAYVAPLIALIILVLGGIGACVYFGKKRQQRRFQQTPKDGDALPGSTPAETPAEAAKNTEKDTEMAGMAADPATGDGVV